MRERDGMTYPADKPPKLHYARPGYRHRLNKWIPFAIFTGICAAFFAGMDWMGVGPPIWAQSLVVAGLTVLMLCAYRYDWYAECRVEGDRLWIMANYVLPRSVPVADIVSIDKVGWSNEYDFVLTVRGKGRMKVEKAVFEPIKPLREALLAINRDIQFGERHDGRCGACGGLIFPPGSDPSIGGFARLWRSGVCPLCGEPFPKFGRFV